MEIEEDIDDDNDIVEIPPFEDYCQIFPSNEEIDISNVNYNVTKSIWVCLISKITCMSHIFD